MEEFQLYFKQIKDIIKDKSHETELTSRTALQNLLGYFIDPKQIRHEPKGEKGLGRPDYRILKNGLTIGCIETKKFNEPLDEILESEQLKRYMEVIPNLILTDYADFIHIRNSQVVKRERLFYGTDSKLDPQKIEKVKELLVSFFMVEPETISKPQKLSQLLAIRARQFNHDLKEWLQNNKEGEFSSRLNSLYELIKITLISELPFDEFIDSYVQTLTYSLFLAKLNSGEAKIDKTHLEIPNSFKVIKELYKTIDVEEIPDHISWIIDEIVDILNHIDPEFRSKISYKTVGNQDFEDPYIYFYEDFLSEYDKSKRKAKGVYYTPIPVVRFIVRSIQEILERDFGESLGSEKVNVLDFACGTGTFLLEAIQIALEGKSESTKQDYIRKRILPNFFGFEYLVAPYTVAHLKLSQYLKDNGFEMSGNERLGVYLTDTLDDQKPVENSMFAKISGEGREANIIKTEKPIWVVMGNPPYSNYSRNNKGFILELIKEYKKNLNEKKLNLNDDYIKFLRFAQCKIEGTTYSYEKTDKTGQGDKRSANIEGHLKGKGCGIVGVITNNSYLDGITHRQMRNSLLGTFDKVYIVNLHGSTLKGEGDQNVFDIMTGVSIVLFVKLPKSPAKKEVFYYSTLEQGINSRDKKYEFLNKNSIGTIGDLFKPLMPTEPDWWFVEKDRSLEVGYKQFFGLKEVFIDYSSGIESGRDNLVIDCSKDVLKNRLNEVLSNKDDKQLREKYDLYDTSGWTLQRFMKSKIITIDNDIRNIYYRPFDIRWILYGKYSLKRDRYEIMKNLLSNTNISLITTRLLSGQEFRHVIVSDCIIDRDPLSSKVSERSYCFPLYLYENQLQQVGSTVAEYVKIPNFKQDFLTFIKEKYNEEFSPEQILGYIYAVLHCPTYRKKYFEFLKVDFPRIPFLDRQYFDQLSKLGQELIDHHLLKIHYPQKELSHLEPSGSNKIEKPEWVDGKMKINASQYFTGISKEVWEFEIGGYKVLQHYLKDRKNRTIDYDEELHIGKTARSLEETIRLMKEIENIAGDQI